MRGDDTLMFMKCMYIYDDRDDRKLYKTNTWHMRNCEKVFDIGQMRLNICLKRLEKEIG